MSVNRLISFGVTEPVSSDRLILRTIHITQAGMSGCLFYQDERRFECVHCTAS